MNWLVRAARWARNPPSLRKVIAFAIVLGVCLAIVGLERLGVWPEWATTDRMPRPRMWGF